MRPAAGRPPGPGTPARISAGVMWPARPAARAFVRLADTLASDFDVVDFLHSLAADSVEILGAEAAGVRRPTRAAGCG